MVTLHRRSPLPLTLDMSTSDERNDFENAYYYFIEALRVLAASPEESCELLGHFNVAFETKFDAEVGPYLFNCSYCPLLSEQRAAIEELTKALQLIPADVLSFTKVPATSLEKMQHPCWQPLRRQATDLLNLLAPLTEQNQRYFNV